MRKRSQLSAVVAVFILVSMVAVPASGQTSTVPGFTAERAAREQPVESLIDAMPGPGVIAYVRPNNVGGDEIHLVAPDGSQDRRIYSTGRAEPAGADIFAIRSLGWRPDAGELAFASDHEYDCSFLQRDI